jgi:hypothetical protein
MKKSAKKEKQKGSDKGIGVVLEHIDAKLNLVVEGQHALGLQIEHVDGKVDNLQREMDYKFETLIDGQNEFRKEVDYKFETVFDELRLIRNELKEKVGRDEFVVLEKRMAELEKRVSHIGK